MPLRGAAKREWQRRYEKENPARREYKRLYSRGLMRIRRHRIRLAKRAVQLAAGPPPAPQVGQPSFMGDLVKNYEFFSQVDGALAFTQEELDSMREMLHDMGVEAPRVQAKGKRRPAGESVSQRRQRLFDDGRFFKLEAS